MKLFLLVLLSFIIIDAQSQKQSPLKAPRVDPVDPIQKYLRAAGLQSGDLWNAAFVYWCFNYFPGGNPLPKTGSGMEMWNRLSSRYKISAEQAKKDPGSIKPGNIFFIKEGDENARVGIVVSLKGDALETVEANTYVILTRRIYPEQVQRMQRKLAEIDLGFTNFTNPPNASAF